MGRFVFNLPDVGEGIAEAEVVSWHVEGLRESLGLKSGRLADAVSTRGKGDFINLQTLIAWRADRTGFAQDSSLEEAGFEPSVSLAKRGPSTGL
jgi:hypothetical protein